MPEHPFVNHQPLPDEFQAKRSVFDRLQAMAVETARARRRLGYVWLEGAVNGLDGGIDGEVKVYARQSGLIEVHVAGAPARLHLERDVYVWDEAMFESRMRD